MYLWGNFAARGQKNRPSDWGKSEDQV